MKMLREMIGELVMVSIPSISDKPVSVRLQAVEDHGIWVENDSAAQKGNDTQLRFVMQSVEKTSMEIKER